MLLAGDSSDIVSVNTTSHGLDPIYAEIRDQSRFWVQRVVVPIIMVVGLFGNIVTVIIMTRRRMRSTTNMYLAALAFVDILYLLLTFLLGLSHYPNMANKRYYTYWRLRPFLMMLTDACSNTSVWLTVTFTVERFIAVKYPMKGKVWCTEQRAKMLIIGVFLFGILSALPVPFEWKVVEKIDPNFNSSSSIPEKNLDSNYNGINGNHSKTTSDDHGQEPRTTATSSTPQDVKYTLDFTEFGQNETFRRIYYRMIAILFSFAPLILLILFNGFLIKSVHESQRERQRMTGASGGSGTATGPTASNRDTQSKQKEPIRRVTKFTLPKDQHQGAQVDCRDSGSFRVSSEQTTTAPTTASSSINMLINEQQPAPIKIGLSEQETSLSTINDSNKNTNSISCANGKTDENNDQTVASTLSKQRLEKNCDKSMKNDKTNADDLFNGKDTNHIGRQTNINPENNQQNQANHSNQYQQQLKQQLTSALLQRGASILRNNYHQNSGHSHASSQERRITIMLIAVVILFLVCQIPTAAMLIYQSVQEVVPNSNEDALLLALGNIFNCLMATNAAGNFILYSFLSKKYRKTFVLLFCNCLKRGDLKTKKKITSNNNTESNINHSLVTSTAV